MNATWKPRLLLPVRLLVLAAAMAILPLSLPAVGEEDKATQSVTPEATTTDEDSAATGQDTAAATEDAAADSTEAVESADAATFVEAASTVDAATSTEAPLDSVDAFSAQPEAASGTSDEPAASPATTTTNPFATPSAGGSQPGIHPRRVPVPADPYHITPGDVLSVTVIASGAAGRHIDNDFVIEPSGSIALGPQYGRVKIGGLSLEDAEKAVAAHLKQTLREPMVQITIGGWREAPTSTSGQPWVVVPMSSGQPPSLRPVPSTSAAGLPSQTWTNSPSASPSEVQGSSDAIAGRREPPASPPGAALPFPWETQLPKAQASIARTNNPYRGLVSTAAAPSITESVGVLKKIAQRSQQDYQRINELAEKNAVSAAEVAQARSEYEINVERLRQGERALRFYRVQVEVAEAEYAALEEARVRSAGAVPNADLRRAKLMVELARAKLEEMSE
jgi:hypothetical protein